MIRNAEDAPLDPLSRWRFRCFTMHEEGQMLPDADDFWSLRPIFWCVGKPWFRRYGHMAITLVDFQSSGGSEVFHWHLGRKFFLHGCRKELLLQSLPDWAQLWSQEKSLRCCRTQTNLRRMASHGWQLPPALGFNMSEIHCNPTVL